MRRLLLTSATTLLALAVLVPPAFAEWVWPLRGEVITPYRNGSDPYASGQHRGIDIAGEVGAAVVAAAGGEVRFAGTAGSSGLTVSIRTADGRLDTSYLHLASTSVREGDRVGAGHRIGAVGTSGTRSATAPHLHFGVRDAGSRHAYHDPLGFLPPPAAGPQPPREAPAPQPAPAPVSPAPAPVQAPAGGRDPVRAPARRRGPLGAPNRRRVPVGAPNPRQVPVGAPHPRRAPVGAPDLRRVPGPAPARVLGPARTPNGRHVPADTPTRASPGDPAHRDPAHRRGHPLAARPSAAAAGHGMPAGGGGPAKPDVHAPTAGPEPAPRDAGEPSSRGPDLGLVLACLGLLAAAALLGLTQDGEKVMRGTRHRIARALQPMLGRR